MKELRVVTMMALALSLLACAPKKISERDQALQKQQQGIDLKRGELNQIAGRYAGVFTSTDGISHDVRIILEVKDIPESAGGADPVLVPRLLGSFRFVLGDEDAGENVDAPIRSSEFIKAKSQLLLVVRHPQFGDLVLSTVVSGAEISGTWNAASLSRSGQVRVKRQALRRL